MIKAVFFDAAGTLFHLPKGVGWHYREVAARHGADLQAEALDRAFRAAWKAAPPPPETRQPRPDDDRGWWQALVGQVLDRCPPGPAFDRERYFAELYSEFTLPGIWQLYPEVPDLLERLSAQYRLAVISNFDGRLRLVLQQLGIARYFEHCVISSEVGAEKPSPFIFEQALAAMNVAASEALHAGDDEACDWEAAAQAGLQVFRLDRPRNTLEALPKFLERD